MADTLPETSALASGEIRVRRATTADAERLAAFSAAQFVETFVDGFGIAYPQADIDNFLGASHSPARYAAMLAEPDMALWVAETGDGALAGYAVAGPCKLAVPGVDPSDGELRRLYVNRGAQGSGLAHSLLRLALDWLGADARPVWLGVWSGNLKAQRFYARYGFEKAAEFDEPVGQTIDREFAMRREAGALSGSPPTDDATGQASRRLWRHDQ